MWNVLLAERILRKTISRQELNVSYISKLSVANLDPTLVVICFDVTPHLCWNCILKFLGREKLLILF